MRGSPRRGLVVLSGMDYLALLRRHDDPRNWGEEESYDHAGALRRLDNFCRDLRSIGAVPHRIDTGMQDASFHADVIVLVPEGTYMRLRFSNFGNFVTIPDEAPEVGMAKVEMPKVVADLLRRHGYTYIPRDILRVPYAGSNVGVGEGFVDWFQRYFGCG